MKPLFFFFCLLSLFLGPLWSEDHAQKQLKEWSLTELSPDLIPNDHPAKKFLDRLFKKNRPLSSVKAFVAAGFEKPKIRTPQHLIIGKHPKLPGFLIKTYLDSQPIEHEWGNLLSRIRGAEAIREYIHARHLSHLFGCPQKWLYVIPSAPKGGKRFLLVVEDMQLISSRKNHEAYRNHISQKTLSLLCTLIQDLGLIDSTYLGNIPYNKNGKICFVDTEWHHMGGVNLKPLLRYLSPENRRFVESLR